MTLHNARESLHKELEKLIVTARPEAKPVSSCVILVGENSFLFRQKMLSCFHFASLNIFIWKIFNFQPSLII